jgi:hypothetical protein
MADNGTNGKAAKANGPVVINRQTVKVVPMDEWLAMQDEVQKLQVGVLNFAVENAALRRQISSLIGMLEANELITRKQAINITLKGG